MRRNTRLVGLALLLAAFAVPLLAEDLTIVSKTSGRGMAPATSTSYYTPDRVLNASGQNATVVELASGDMRVIDHAKKTYFEITREQLKAKMAELEAMMASNPGMAAMLGPATEVEVTHPGDKRTIAGHEATHHVLKLGTTMTFDLWVAPDVRIPVGYHDAHKLAYSFLGPMASRFTKMVDAMQGLGGMPLATTTRFSMMGQETVSESEVIEIRYGPVDPAVFAPPAGYKKTASPFG